MAVAAKCILMWKDMTKHNKTKDRVQSLESALRATGKGDIADTFMQCYNNNQDLAMAYNNTSSDAT